MDGEKLSVRDLAKLEFVGSGKPASRIVRVSGRSYRVDMTKPASASISLSGSKKSKTKVRGPASSVVKLLSAATGSEPSVVRSFALSIYGAKPIGG